MANPLFAVGGPLGPLAPGMPGSVNPLALAGMSMYQGSAAPMLAGAQMAQAAQARADEQAHRDRLLALEVADRARRLERDRKAAEGLQALTGGVYGQLAPDLQTDANRRAVEGLGAIPGGPAILANVWARQAGLTPPGEQFRQIPADEAKRRDLDTSRGQVYQESTKTGRVTTIGGGGVQVNVGEGPGDLPGGWYWNPATEQAEKIPGFELEAERKERQAQENFQKSFSEFDRAAHRYLMDKSVDNLVQFQTAARSYAEDLAARRAAPRSPTDADVERAYNEAAGVVDLGLGTYQPKMDQTARMFGVTRPELDWGGRAQEPVPDVGSEWSEAQEAELQALEAEKAETAPRYRMGRRVR